MRNPLTGRIAGKSAQKSKSAVSEEQEERPKASEADVKNKKRKLVSLSTMLYLMQSDARHEQRFHAYFSRFDPLRLSSLDQPILMADAIDHINSANALELSSIRAALMETKDSPLNTMLLLDACQSRFNDPFGSRADLHACVCAGTLPNLVGHLVHAIFLPVVPETEPLGHLFWKIMPRGNAARSFDSMEVKYSKHSPFMRRVIPLLIRCSLLGNYEHDISRLPVASRFLLSEWMQPASVSEESPIAKYIQTQWIHDCPRVFVFALRDYVVYMLEQHPILRKHFDAKFDYASFKSVTGAALAWVRTFIDTHIDSYLDIAKHRESLKDEVNTKLEWYHKRMLNARVHKQKPSWFEFLGTMRSHAPVDQRRILRQIKLHKDADVDDLANSLQDIDIDVSDESDEDEDMNEDDVDALVMQNPMSAAALHALALQKAKPKPKQVRLTKKGVVPEVSATIWDIMHSMDIQTKHDDLMTLLTSLLPSLGADPRGVSSLNEMNSDYVDGSVPNTTWRVRVYHFSREFPHTWALIVCAWTAWTMRQGIRLHKLDYSTTKYQLEALCERYNCTQDQIPISAMRVCVCMGCQNPRTLIADPARASTKAKYSHGLESVSIDFYTGILRCRGYKSNMHFKCGQELMCAPILGHALEFDGRIIMMCPQKKGGHLFFFDPEHSTINERGVACPDCTLALAREKHKRAIETDPYGAAARLTCSYCQKLLTRDYNTFVYAKGVQLCKKHHSDSLRWHLYDTVDEHTIRTRMTNDIAANIIFKAIVNYIRDRRENYKENMKGKYNQINKMFKRAKWGKGQ